MEVTSYNCRILGGVTIITAVAVVIFYHLFGNYEPSSHESEHPESLSLARPRPSPSDQCFQRLGYLSKSLPDFNVLFRNLDFNVECLSAIDGVSTCRLNINKRCTSMYDYLTQHLLVCYGSQK